MVWWFDHPVDVGSVEAEIVAQTVRLILQREAGAPRSLAAAVGQEGRAAALAVRDGAHSRAAADALEVLATDPSLSTMVAYLYGDDAADGMGYTPVRLTDREGYEHAIAVAHAALAAKRGGEEDVR